jgi:phage shock protein PspC (stress-responsive transcriptional regulator)
MTRRLTRDTKNAVLGGVCAGFASYFGVDPVLVRLAFILLVVLNGFGLIAYVVGWVIMPRGELAAGSATSTASGTPGAPPVTDPAGRIVESVRQAGEKVADGFQRLPDEKRRGSAIAGGVLIVLGTIFLLDRMSWWHWPYWARFSNLWPVILIAVGVSLIFEAARGRGGKSS